MIVHTAGYIGHLEKTDMGVRVKNMKIVRELDGLLADFIKYSKSTPEDVNKLLNELDKNKYEVCIFTPEDKRKRRNEKKNEIISVKRHELETLSEHAIQFCRGCKRNITKCALRKVLKNLKIPFFNENLWGVCEYDQDV